MLGFLEIPRRYRGGCFAAFSIGEEQEPEGMMRRFLCALAFASLVALVGLGVSGCSSESGTGGKAEGQKMGTEKMSSDKMGTDKMGSDKMGSDKMGADKMGGGK